MAPLAVATPAFVIPVLAAAGASAVNKPAVLEPGTAWRVDRAFAAERTEAGVFAAADIAEPAAVIVGLPAGYLAGQARRKSAEMLVFPGLAALLKIEQRA